MADTKEIHKVEIHLHAEHEIDVDTALDMLGDRCYDLSQKTETTHDALSVLLKEGLHPVMIATMLNAAFVDMAKLGLARKYIRGDK